MKTWKDLSAEVRSNQDKQYHKKQIINIQPPAYIDAKPVYGKKISLSNDLSHCKEEIWDTWLTSRSIIFFSNNFQWKSHEVMGHALKHNVQSYSLDFRYSSVHL